MVLWSVGHIHGTHWNLRSMTIIFGNCVTSARIGSTPKASLQFQFAFADVPFYQVKYWKMIPRFGNVQVRHFLFVMLVSVLCLAHGGKFSVCILFLGICQLQANLQLTLRWRNNRAEASILHSCTPRNYASLASVFWWFFGSSRNPGVKWKQQCWVKIFENAFKIWISNT